MTHEEKTSGASARESSAGSSAETETHPTYEYKKMPRAELWWIAEVGDDSIIAKTYSEEDAERIVEALNRLGSGTK